MLFPCHASFLKIEPEAFRIAGWYNLIIEGEMDLLSVYFGNPDVTITQHQYISVYWTGLNTDVTQSQKACIQDLGGGQLDLRI